MSFLYSALRIFFGRDLYKGVEAKLKELGLELPPTPRPAANYVGAVQTSNLLFISGHRLTKD